MRQISLYVFEEHLDQYTLIIIGKLKCSLLLKKGEGALSQIPNRDSTKGDGVKIMKWQKMHSK